MGKLIVIEGIDCSGKETQSKMLVEHLKEMGIAIKTSQFPRYDTPTGKIIGGPYLGKEWFGDSYFEEASQVSPFVASLYYAADRKYNVGDIEETLKTSNLILDRYVDSNMAHQGGKFETKKERENAYKFFEQLEYKLLKLPRPEIRIFLDVTPDVSRKIAESRAEKLDALERDFGYLEKSYTAYHEVAKRNKYKIIKCVENGKMRSREDIHKDVYNYVIQQLKK